MRGMRVVVRVVVRGGGPIIVDANGSSVTVIVRGVTDGCTVIIAIGTVGLRVIVWVRGRVVWHVREGATVRCVERVVNGEKSTNAIRGKAGGNFADGSAVVVRVVVRVMFRSFGETIIVVRLVVGVLGDGRDSRFASCFANLVGRFVALIDLLIKARQWLTVGIAGADALRLQVTVSLAPIAL
jgi:hypothetical protein